MDKNNSNNEQKGSKGVNQLIFLYSFNTINFI